MRPPKNTWPKTVGADGILMFAQLMSEMLSDQSFESYRAFTLDTIARIDEALLILKDIQRNRIPKEAFEPVQRELVWSLQKDPVAQDAFGEELSIFKESLGGSKFNDTEIKQHINFMKKKLNNNYKKQCEKKILKIYSDENDRISLRHVTGFYCSHLINFGYSKLYLRNLVDQIFFSKNHARTRAATLKKFFSRLDGKKRDFLVCTTINKDYEEFIKSLNVPIFGAASDLPSSINSAVSKELPLPANQSYVLMRGPAFDDGNAITRAENVLNIVRALTFTVPHNFEFSWGRNMYVASARTNKGRVLLSEALPLQRVFSARGAVRRALKSLGSYSDKLLKHFDEGSTSRLLRSLNTSALARTSVNIESQLISLWSAIEVLLSEPAPDSARIVHYCRLLIPCICMRYVRRQFISVYDSMLVSYRKKFTSIINMEPNTKGLDQHTRFAAVLCLSGNDALQEDLLNLCSDNPLARHRLWKLHRDYSSPCEIKKTLEGHETRVGWQIHRIYRARNNLVHSGIKQSYLDSLVLNLDEYYRACLGTLLNRASRSGGKAEVNQLIGEVFIEYEIYKRHIAVGAKKNILDKESFLRVIQ